MRCIALLFKHYLSYFILYVLWKYFIIDFVRLAVGQKLSLETQCEYEWDIDESAEFAPHKNAWLVSELKKMLIALIIEILKKSKS